VTLYLTDESTSYELLSFFIKRIKRRFVMLRDPKTKRFVKFVRVLYICVTCTFESTDPSRHPSKNLYVESQVEGYLTYEDWRDIESDEDFDQLIKDTANELSKECDTCFENFGVDYEVAGYEVHTMPCGEYCKYGRPHYWAKEKFIWY